MNKKILVKDKDGNVLKVYDSKVEVCLGEGIGISTLTRNLRGITKNPENGRFYEWEGKRNKRGQDDSRRFNRNAVVLLDSNGNFIKEYKCQLDLAKDKGIPQAVVSMYLNGKTKGRTYKSMYKFISKEDYDDLYGEVEESDEESQNEIIKKKTTEYYINVLVGLANQTLIDGAVYDMNGTKLMYNKKNDSLELNGIVIHTKDEMFKEVQVELPLLTQNEKEFLRQLVKAFSRINGIRKCKSVREGFEFIRVETGIDEDIVLPDFKEGLYYSNLQQNRLYSVEELEIQ